MDGVALGDATVVVSSNSSSAEVRFTGMEPLAIADLAALEIDRFLFVGAEQLTLDLPVPTDLGLLTRVAGGTITATSGVVLQAGNMFEGDGSVLGPVAAEPGTTITATGALQLGDDSRIDGFVSDGVLRIGAHAVTLHDQDLAVLGSLTELGNSAGSGVLAAPQGLLLEPGKSLQGFGTINADLVNQGHVVRAGTAAEDVLDLLGHVSGTGEFAGNIRFSGVFAPGDNHHERTGNPVFLPSHERLRQSHLQSDQRQ